MKKFYTLIYFIILSIYSNAQIDTRVTEDNRGSFILDHERKFIFTFALNVLPFKSKDFEDFDISDWQKYGLLSQNPSSQEGRVRVPLSDSRISGLAFGLNFGFGYKFLNYTPQLEYNASFSNFSTINSFTLGCGIEYYKYKDKITFEALPKIGYLYGKAQFDDIELIYGYTPPVIISQGNFSNGDTIKCRYSGVGLQIGHKFKYEINDNIDLFVQPEICLMLASGMKITITGRNANSNKREDIELDINDPAIVKADRGNKQAKLDPRIANNGLGLRFGINFKI